MGLKIIFDKFGAKLKEDIQQALRDEGIEYDGQDSRLSASTKFLYSENNGHPAFRLTMNDYWEAINEGRGAGEKPPPIEPIKKWIERKNLFLGISLKNKAELRATKTKLERKDLEKQQRAVAITSAAIAISKSIGKKGWEGNKFMDKILNDGRMEELQKEVSEYLKREIIITFSK
jgi:hypothetical protein